MPLFMNPLVHYLGNVGHRSKAGHLLRSHPLALLRVVQKLTKHCEVIVPGCILMFCLELVPDSLWEIIWKIESAINTDDHFKCEWRA